MQKYNNIISFTELLRAICGVDCARARVERGRAEDLEEDVWMTDTTIGRSWFYQPQYDGQWHSAN